MGAQIRQRSCDLMGAIIALCVKIFKNQRGASWGREHARDTDGVDSGRGRWDAADLSG